MHILHYPLIIGSKYLLYTWIEMRFNILLEENNRALKERDIFCFQTEGDCDNQPMVCICISVSVGRKRLLILKFLTFFCVLNYIFPRAALLTFLEKALNSSIVLQQPWWVSGS